MCLKKLTGPEHTDIGLRLPDRTDCVVMAVTHLCYAGVCQLGAAGQVELLQTLDRLQRGSFLLPEGAQVLVSDQTWLLVEHHSRRLEEAHVPESPRKARHFILLPRGEKFSTSSLWFLRSN